MGSEKLVQLKYFNFSCRILLLTAVNRCDRRTIESRKNRKINLLLALKVNF